MNTIKHFQNYPIMKPRIGKNWRSEDKKEFLLVIGESHYLPEGSTAHLNAEQWYLSDESSLSDEEKRWLHTEGIIDGAISDRFRNKAHWIYKNIAIELNNCGLNYGNPYDALDDVTYYNFFQRPADMTGKSIIVTECDKENSNEILSSIISELQPTVILFVSRLASDCARPVMKDSGIPHSVTPHPTCAWWNKVSKRYQGKGREVPRKLLTEEVQWLA